MKRVAGAVLILTLAACAKHEPAPAASGLPDKNVGGSLSPDKSATSGQKAPPTSKAASPATVAIPDPAATAGLLKLGEEVFAKTCATCHMADGYGVPNLQPQIVGSGWISAADPQPLLSLILRGSAILGEAAKAYGNDMAPQDSLTDAEIAAVATYVRSRFAAVPVEKPVTPAEVALARQRPGLPQ